MPQNEAIQSAASGKSGTLHERPDAEVDSDPVERAVWGRRARATRRVAAGTLGLAGVLLAACGPTESGGGTGGAAGPKKAPVTLQVGSFPPNSPEDLEVHRSIWTAFSQARPHVTLHVDEQGTNPTKLLAQLAANTPPDAAAIHPNDLATVAAAGGYQRLDDLVAKDKTVDVKLFQTGLLEYFKFKGGLLQLPYYSGPSMMFYNKTLFQRSGVKLPDDYDREGKWTWDGGFLEAARQLAQGSGGSRIYAFHPKARALAMQASAVWSNGGDLIDWANHSRSALTTPATLEAFQIQADFTTKHRVVPPPAEEAEFGGGWDCLKGFTTGRIAMFFGGRGWIPTLKTIRDFEVAMWHHPKGKAGRVHRDGPNGYGVVTGAKQTEEAWEFVKFYSGTTAQVLLVNGGRNVPTTTRKEDLDAFRKAVAPFEKPDVHLEAARGRRALAPLPTKWGEMNRVYGDSWSQVLNGGVEVKPALEDLSRQWEQLLKG